MTRPAGPPEEALAHCHVCSFTDFADITLVTWDGQVFRFEFSRRFGPVMIGKRGHTVERVPPQRSSFWKALHWWGKQGHRIDDHGCCVYDMPPLTRYVRLCGRQWAQVPDGHDPADVRRKWCEKAKRPAPNDRLEVTEILHDP